MAAAIGEAVHQCPAGRVRIALMHQHIGDPDAQAVDQDHAVQIVGFCKGFRQVERGLDKLPVRAAAFAVELDPLFYFLIEDFGGRDIDRVASGRFSKAFRMCRFSGPRAAEDKLDLCHRTCLPCRSARKRAKTVPFM